MEHSPRFLALCEAARARVREIAIDELLAWQKQGRAFRLIDVREESEWGAGHLPGASHLCKGILERDVERTIPEADATVVLYCGGGFRSALAADAMRQMGYTNVRSLRGGWRAWCARGLPVEP
jgi:rhodanese-related sulfurtransferase